MNNDHLNQQSNSYYVSKSVYYKFENEKTFTNIRLKA